MAFMHLSPEAHALYQDVHWGKVQAGTFVIASDSRCEVGAVYPRPAATAARSSENGWNEMVSALPADRCAFLVANFDYVSTSDQVERSKVLFVVWAPAGAPIKEKMLSAFCARAIIAQCGSGGGIAAQLQGGCFAEVEYEVVREKILRMSTVK
jgi:hypothetical protein